MRFIKNQFIYTIECCILFLMEIIPPQYKSGSVRQLKDRLQVLKVLIKQFTVIDLKEKDMKFLYFHLRRLLITLHLLMHYETLNIEKDVFTQAYVKYLFKRTNKVIFRSEFVSYSFWQLAKRHGLVDVDARLLIKKMSSIMAFSRA